jgi:hypothetical protein
MGPTFKPPRGLVRGFIRPIGPWLYMRPQRALKGQVGDQEQGTLGCWATSFVSLIGIGPGWAPHSSFRKPSRRPSEESWEDSREDIMEYWGFAPIFGFGSPKNPP